MEGGDTWAYDSATSVHPYFNISGLADGSADLTDVNGEGFSEGFNWSYTGENNWIDHLDPIGSASVLFSNPSLAYNCGIAYDSGNYKTVGCSFEITGLNSTRFEDALLGILNFFDVPMTDSEDENTPAIKYSLNNYPNPFNPSTKISFSIPVKEKVSIEVFNALGQKVSVLVDEEMTLGSHSIIWDGTDDRGNTVASGIYLYKMKAGGRYTSTKKMILLK